ncbi:hypothetical protein vBVhaSVHB1_110 [Vibrio phage vB_VhaS-VHB1]|nr:hypothetical protein vBVhaSVHB1_110 [Vibrio phage vB_VhaS-VHB1]
MSTIVRNFWVLPQGASTTRKRNKFLGKKHNAIVLNGYIRDQIAKAANFKGDGLLPVSHVPLEALLEIQTEAANKGDHQVFKVLRAIIVSNFLEEDITAASKESLTYGIAQDT